MANGIERNERGNWRRSTSVHLLALALLGGLVFFTGLGQSRLWDRDEPRNAGCAAEMLARGDWVVPMFNDELRPQKPVLLYWLMMAAYSLFGQNEWSARFPSAALGLGTVFATYGIGRRLFGPTTGWLAAAALATSLMFTVAARAATPDSLLIFCSTLAIGCYVWGTFDSHWRIDLSRRLKTEGSWFPRSWTYVLGMYGAMSLGVLAKGPVGMVLPTAIVGMFLLLQRLPTRSSPTPQSMALRWLQRGLRWLRPFEPRHFLRTCWTMRPLVAVGLVLAIAGSWYLWVGLRTDGDFLTQFFLTENLGRATESFENHAGGWWFYPLTILVGFFPWTIFAIPILLDLPRQIGERSPHRSATRLLLCWVLVQITLFSLAQTKLPSYITPCYPGLALLTGMALADWARGEASVPFGWYRWGMTGLVTSGILVAIGLGWVGQQFLHNLWPLAWIGSVLIVGGIAAAALAWQNRRPQALAAVLVTGVAFSISLFGWGATTIDATRQTDVLLENVRSAGPETQVATFRCLESSWVVYAGRPIFELDPAASDPKRDLFRAQFWHPKPRLTPRAFVAAVDDAWFITTDEHLSELQRQLETETEIVATVPFFLKPDRQLILLRPVRQTMAGHSRTPLHRR